MYRLAILLSWANLALTGLSYTYGNNTEAVQYDSKQVSQDFFPDPDIKLHSPAFLDGYDDPQGFHNGTSGPTSDETLFSFLKTFVDSHEWATYHEIEDASEESRTIPYITLSTDKAAHNEPFPDSKLKVWIQGGQHGNEPAGDQAVMAFIGLLGNDSDYALHLLEDIDFLIVPRYNPDGVNYFQRILPSYYDPNRDHTKLSSYQTQTIKCLYNKFRPHVAVDQHEFTPSSRSPEEGVTTAIDALYAAAKNLNIDPRIRDLSEQVFATQIDSTLKDNNFRGHSYFTYSKSSNKFSEAGSNAIIGRNSYGLTQAISFLTETRGINLGDQEFKRRTAVGLSIVKTIVDVARQNSAKVYQTVQDARMTIGTSASKLPEIILTDSQPVSKQTLPFINTNSSTLDDIEIDWASATPTAPNATVSPPHAYIIPSAWKSVAKRLQALGVYVKKIDQEWSTNVEYYTIDSASPASTYYEGAFRYAVTTSTGNRQITIPKNSYIVPSNQPNAALAFVTLEPVSSASYVTYNIIPVIEGDEYPIFRIPKDKSIDIYEPNGEQFQAPSECMLV